MRKKLPKILITGAAGFIGSAFVRLLVKRRFRPIVVDKLTYAGDLKRLAEVEGKYTFYKVDICDKKKISEVLKKERPSVLINFSAETHVDRSIVGSAPFIQTNINGTYVLLELLRAFGIKRYIHLSTDEIYGEIEKGRFCEDSPIKPNSPYSASKAAADLLIRSYIRTYNFPAIIIRPCNNYGPWQYPEKLIPLAILKVLRGQKIPVYARGKNVREWLYVEDSAEGIYQIMQKGRMGEVYNLGSAEEKQNIEVVRALLKIMGAPESRYEFVKDRPGHDFRYRLDSHKVYNDTGWKPKVKFNQGLKLTVIWALKQKGWLLNKW